MRRRSAAAARRSIHWPSGLRQKCALKVSDRQCYTLVLVERLVLEDDPSASKPPSTKATHPRAFSSCAIWGFVAGQGGVAAGAPRHQSSSALGAQRPRASPPEGGVASEPRFPDGLIWTSLSILGLGWNMAAMRPLAMSAKPSSSKFASDGTMCSPWTLRYPKSRTWWSSTFPQAIPHRNGSSHIQFPLSYTTLPWPRSTSYLKPA